MYRACMADLIELEKKFLAEIGNKSSEVPGVEKSIIKEIVSTIVFTILQNWFRLLVSYMSKIAIN